MVVDRISTIPCRGHVSQREPLDQSGLDGSMKLGTLITKSF